MPEAGYREWQCMSAICRAHKEMRVEHIDERNGSTGWLQRKDRPHGEYRR